nr:cytochrome P450 9e2-like [Megalopta genalis]
MQQMFISRYVIIIFDSFDIVKASSINCLYFISVINCALLLASIYSGSLSTTRKIQTSTSFIYIGTVTMVDVWVLTLALCVVLIAALYYYMTGLLRYFRDREIPEVNNYAILEIIKVIFQRITVAGVVLKMYRSHPDAKYVGSFDMLTPVLTIRDLELIKSITVKNFEHFQDHKMILVSSTEPLFNKNLLGLTGDRWKEVRNLLSPAFTSSKMKAMFTLMRECGDRYGKYFATLPENGRSVELKDAFTRYTNDVIATCSFGVNVDSMADRDNKFYVYGKTATTFGALEMLKFLVQRTVPRLSLFLGIRVLSPAICSFFENLVATTIKTRDEQGIVRPDMIQLMMETRGKLGPGKELTIEDMTAQAFIFYLGGFESTSILMCFAAYEIGVNPEIQKRLQEEIDEVLESNNGEVTYEAINDMKYLDAVINEALRMYPAIVVTDRVCTKPFELPPALPGLKSHIIEKDCLVSIPIYGIQQDPQYFDTPTKFKPDRFLDDSKKILNSGAFLSFGAGPRMCIGNRFALLETKVLLFNLFARCNLKPNSKTTIPMRLKGFQMTSAGGFWFDIEPRKVAAPDLVTSD